jgi:hypothetical protein
LHSFDLALEQIILLTSIVCVLCIVLEATELGVEALFGLLAAADVVDGWTDACVSSVHSFVMGFQYLPFVRISHLLAFVPPFAGTALFKSSKRSFISLRRLRSASLWLTRSSGVLL